MKLTALVLSAAALCGTAVCLIAAHSPSSRQPQRLWSLAQHYQLEDISPDGKLAAYIDWTTDGNLVVRDLASGATRDLTKKTVQHDEAEDALFSPDGKRILFDWTDSKGNFDEFRMVGADGSDLKTVYRVSLPRMGLWPAMWTADGASILMWVTQFDSNHVKRGSSLGLLPAAGGTPRLIPGDGVGNARISADGRFIAGTTHDNHDIVIISAVDGKEVSRVASSSEAMPMRFTADGLVFSSGRGGSPGIWKQPMSNGKPHGEPHLVRGDLWRLREALLDASGRLYYEINAGDRDAYMVNIDAETGRTRSQPMPLSKDPGADYFAPQFSPDGKYVAMTTRPGRRAAEVLIRSLSGDEVRRFPVATFANSAQWIPGSQALALTLFDSTGGQNLVRLDLVSGAQSMLVSGVNSTVAFSPDGKTVYYAPRARTDTVAPRIVARELASGSERTVYSAPRGSSVLATAVSRDGKTLIVALVHTLREHPYKILAVSTASGAVRDLSAAVSGADTANGGQRALGFTADLTAQILLAPKLDAAHTLTMWRVPLTGGAATELGPAPKGIEFNNRQTAGSWLSPDATRLVYVGGSLQSELWVIDEPAVRAQLATHH
jgi:Tol biopolymer transport system component